MPINYLTREDARAIKQRIRKPTKVHSKYRIAGVFSFGAKRPKEHNIIVFDDFVTIGPTMISKKTLLKALGKKTRIF